MIFLDCVIFRRKLFISKKINVVSGFFKIVEKILEN